MNVVVDGLMVNYQKIGSGKTIVLLHGWGDGGTSFAALAARLASDYGLYVVDLPGFGASQAPDTAWSLDNYVTFINHWQAKLGLKNIYAYIAHSYGGSIAIKGLGNKSLKASKLVLVASAGIRAKKQARKQLLKAFTKIAKWPVKLLPASHQKRIRQRFYKTIGSEMLVLPHMEQTFRQIINEDVRTAAERINIPTLLIYGDRDKSTPLSDGQVISQAINGSELKSINGGHFIHQQQSEEVSRLVKDFLK